MAWTAVGSAISASAKTFTWAPSAVGNMLVCIAYNKNTAPVTAVASSNATWTARATDLVEDSSNPAYSGGIFSGIATSTTSETVSLTSTDATAADFRVWAHEFNPGGATVNYDKTVASLVNPAGTTWPTFTPTNAGSLCVGYELNYGSATAGTTTGWTYYVDSNGNGAAYDLSVATTGSAPVWGDSDDRIVVGGIFYTSTTTATTSALLQCTIL